MDFRTNLCVETCGDGRKFTLECDDGNNVDGDGCSNDCKVEVGSVCTGGSPQSKDLCSRNKPNRVDILSTGQAHLYGKIVLNIKVNYLPMELINSAVDCKDKCENILSVRIVEGDKSTTGILAKYIKGTSFSFSVEIDFGR